MSLGLLFWILMLLWVVWHGYGIFSAPGTPPPPWPTYGPPVILFILLLCLGWKVFGSPIQ